LVKSLTLPIIQYKIFHNFWTSLDSRNKKQKAKNFKQNQKEIVNDGILLKFWISNISIFIEKKNYSFAGFFDKISDPYNKTTQKF